MFLGFKNDLVAHSVSPFERACRNRASADPSFCTRPGMILVSNNPARTRRSVGMRGGRDDYLVKA